jgi:hypothetical protein
MKLGKLLFAAVGASVLLGALVSTASARNLEVTQTTSALWARMDFEGGFGKVECEVKLSGSFHGRTLAKAPGSLIGFITEGTVLRCRRGGATIRQESLPWHRSYTFFFGTLPAITGFTETITGAEWQVREPFSITCIVRRENSFVTGDYEVSAGHVTRYDFVGESPCSGINAAVVASTTNVGTITVRLI